MRYTLLNIVVVSVIAFGSIAQGIPGGPADEACDLAMHTDQLGGLAMCVNPLPMIEHDVTTIMIGNTTESIEHVAFINVMAHCTVVPCDFYIDPITVGYTQTTETCYSVQSGMSVTLQAEFTIALLQKVGASASFYINGTRERCETVSTSVQWPVIVDDCWNKVWTVTKTLWDVEGQVKVIGEKATWYFPLDFENPWKEILCNQILDESGGFPIETYCNVRFYNGNSSRMGGYNVSLDPELCCPTPGCCGRECEP